MRYLLVVVLVLGAIVYGGLKWHAKVQHEKALAYQRQQELLAQEKAEAERKEQEAKAASAKEKAVQLLRAFLGRQEQLLKDTVEESKIQAELISEDQKRLSEELVALEKENLRKAEEARKRNRKRHDRAEDVLTMLKSPVLNKLAATYLGEDFSAMRADYQSKVSAIVNMQKETRRRLDANRAKYEKAVEGIDEEVDNKNTVARKKISSANEAFERRLRNLYQEKKNLEAKLKKLNGPLQIRGPHLRREIEDVEKSLGQVTEEVGKVEEIVALSQIWLIPRRQLLRQVPADVMTAPLRHGKKMTMLFMKTWRMSVRFLPWLLNTRIVRLI